MYFFSEKSVKECMNYWYYSCKKSHKFYFKFFTLILTQKSTEKVHEIFKSFSVKNVWKIKEVFHQFFHWKNLKSPTSAIDT